MSRNLLEKKVTKTKTSRDTAREYDRSRSSVVLMEIIISILLFMLVGSVCIQLFVQSYRMNNESEILERSSMLVSSAADQLLLNNGDIAAVSQYYSDYVLASDVLCLYFDGNFNICNYTSYAYLLEISVSDKESNKESKLRDIDMIMYNHNKENIYEMKLEVVTYDN